LIWAVVSRAALEIRAAGEVALSLICVTVARAALPVSSVHFSWIRQDATRRKDCLSWAEGLGRKTNTPHRILRLRTSRKKLDDKQSTRAMAVAANARSAKPSLHQWPRSSRVGGGSPLQVGERPLRAVLGVFIRGESR
jgi:hypothetical protein